MLRVLCNVNVYVRVLNYHTTAIHFPFNAAARNELGGRWQEDIPIAPLMSLLRGEWGVRPIKCAITEASCRAIKYGSVVSRTKEWREIASVCVSVLSG